MRVLFNLFSLNWPDHQAPASQACCRDTLRVSRALPTLRGYFYLPRCFAPRLYCLTVGGSFLTTSLVSKDFASLVFRLTWLGFAKGSKQASRHVITRRYNSEESSSLALTRLILRLVIAELSIDSSSLASLRSALISFSRTTSSFIKEELSEAQRPTKRSLVGWNCEAISGACILAVSSALQLMKSEI